MGFLKNVAYSLVLFPSLPHCQGQRCTEFPQKRIPLGLNFRHFSHCLLLFFEGFRAWAEFSKKKKPRFLGSLRPKDGSNQICLSSWNFIRNFSYFRENTSSVSAATSKLASDPRGFFYSQIISFFLPPQNLILSLPPPRDEILKIPLLSWRVKVGH